MDGNLAFVAKLQQMFAARMYVAKLWQVFVGHSSKKLFGVELYTAFVKEFEHPPCAGGG